MTSRIVKSAYRNAVKAGFKGSLKQWAKTQVDNNCLPHMHDCAQWIENKNAQRQTSANRRANRGHADVHEMQRVRSFANTLRGRAPSFPAKEGR